MATGQPTQPAQLEPVPQAVAQPAGVLIGPRTVLRSLYAKPTRSTHNLLLCADPHVPEYAALWHNVRVQETFGNWQKLVQYIMKSVRSTPKLANFCSCPVYA